jgi:hypothetical protein
MKKYYVKKGEFSGEIGELIEDAEELTLQMQDTKLKVPHHYCTIVPELGDKVSLEAPVEFTVVERLKANQPFVKIEAWVRVDDVEKI